MPTWYFFARPSNLGFHDLTQESTRVPKNLASLLGLGLKFIPTPRSTPTKSKLDTMCTSRLFRDMRLKSFYAGEPNNFEPSKMYIPSNWTPKPWLFPKEIALRLNKFEAFLRANFKHRKKRTDNLLPHQRETLRSLQQSESLLVVQCDKNLGPAVIERNEYILMVNRDHLSDRSTYEQMSKEEAENFVSNTIKIVQRWLKRHKTKLTKMERRFVAQSIVGNKDPLCKFYATMKVHKTPLKSRPIVSCSGSLLENLGTWVDRKLQHFLPMFDSYFKSSEDMLADLREMILPPGSRLFIADAVSMYTNIPTDTALRKITNFLRRHQRHINENLPYDAIIEGLGIIMRRCAFSFGDTFWAQKTGTAMGTPPAPPYATMYYGLWEQKMLKRHQPNLYFYRRFIDDVFGIWVPMGENDDEKWDAFVRDLDGAEGLTWEVTDGPDKVDFMDLTLSIDGDRIRSTLYEKPSNRHLYIPSHSAHPPGVINGIIHGMIRRIYTLCSDEQDCELRTSKFLDHLRARGYHREAIMPIVRTAVARAKSPPPPVETTTTNPNIDRVFLHLPFHPESPPSRVVQRAWKQHVSRPIWRRKLRDVKNHVGRKVGVDRLTVAYHRDLNLGNLLSYRDLSKRKGPTVSSII